MWTHFAVAEEDPEFTGVQIAPARETLATLAAAGHRPGLVHAANTAGALGRDDARYDLVRCGLGIYGMRPDPAIAPDLEPRPAMRVVSHVTMVRRLEAGERPSYGRRRPLPADATVATVPIGYADGLPGACRTRRRGAHRRAEAPVRRDGDHGPDRGRRRRRPGPAR